MIYLVSSDEKFLPSAMVSAEVKEDNNSQEYATGIERELISRI